MKRTALTLVAFCFGAFFARQCAREVFDWLDADFTDKFVRSGDEHLSSMMHFAIACGVLFAVACGVSKAPPAAAWNLALGMSVSAAVAVFLRPVVLSSAVNIKGDLIRVSGESIRVIPAFQIPLSGSVAILSVAFVRSLRTPGSRGVPTKNGKDS